MKTRFLKQNLEQNNDLKIARWKHETNRRPNLHIFTYNDVFSRKLVGYEFRLERIASGMDYARSTLPPLHLLTSLTCKN